ncbi:MAG: DUF3472 domain-containing protein [Candidatus Marinimicrobia bacterium]|nr:DUF3472 domain-containing protein [Candidatus Neomarinimicrobiota bacterium]
MKTYQNSGKLLFLTVLVSFWPAMAANPLYTTTSWTHTIPFAGNSWTESYEDHVFDHRGISNWSKPATIINTYFKTSAKGEFFLALVARVQKGESTISLSFNNTSHQMVLSSTELDTFFVGAFEISEPGYQKIQFQGIKKDAAQFAEISSLLIAGKATEDKIYYVSDEFYWGRRGPSVHLNYFPPSEAQDIVWFYNEINVPHGEDVLGSYFMANGFGEGYFGIQVNSDDERRILFSVWSPFVTDDPASIPEDQKIKLLKKGDHVHTGEFGNEGSGGQSYRKYLWKAGTTYSFLLKGEPSENNATDFTAYFFAPEIGQWELIASFRRPQTSTYLTHHHSFLENFIPNTGNLSRKGYFQNQWICDSRGRWHEMTKARFTADNTARKEARMDFAGGIDGEKFFLKNCGFFGETTPIGQIFTRVATHQPPKIDFSKLP